MDRHRFFPAPNDDSYRGQTWFWRLPLVAVGVIIALFTFFVWFGLNQEFNERQAGLVSDTLWMEQNLRLQLNSTEETLAQIGNEFGISGDLYSDEAQEKAQSLLQGSSGLVGILWLDAYGNTMSTLPASADPVKTAPTHAQTLLRARSLNRSTYTPPYLDRDGQRKIEVIVPVFGANDFSGYAVGIYSLDRLVEKQVPWWFSERYRLTLTSSTLQKETASPGQPDMFSDTLSFKVAVERAAGLELRVVAHRATTRLMPLIVAGVLLSFGLVIVWSFWMLRKHVVSQHLAEEALRREYTFRVAMENSTLVGLRAHDMEGRITYVNAAFCRLVGWSEEELLGRKAPMPYWLPTAAPYSETAEVFEGAGQPGESAQVIETQFRRKNGEIIDVLVSQAPLNDASGRQTGWMGSILDITERKRAESLARAQQERLEATARLVTMGEMASTLAHEINQPLSAIASYSAGCLNAIRAGRFDEGQFTEVLSKINHQAQRAGRIVHRIYGYVRRTESRNEPMEINASVKEAISLLEPEAARKKVQICEELSEANPVICAERTMIEQLIVNLIRNGMDAMTETSEADRKITVRTSKTEERSILVTVIDRGCGIAPENAAKLFDSFFTTKPEGMGMGLKICRTIAEQHMGKLWFEPAEGGGTAFFLQIPVDAT